MAALLSRFNHDLRTPLNTILGWTHLLQKGGLDTVREKHVADVIARNSREQTQLLEDFVDDGRAILGALQLQMVAVKMDEALTEAIGRLGSLLSLHSVSLQPKFDAPDVSVSGDVRRLTRLAYRLLAIVTQRARESTTLKSKPMSIEGSTCLPFREPRRSPTGLRPLCSICASVL